MSLGILAKWMSARKLRMLWEPRNERTMVFVLGERERKPVTSVKRELGGIVRERSEIWETGGATFSQIRRC